jgi:hypothetical protein
MFEFYYAENVLELWSLCFGLELFYEIIKSRLMHGRLMSTTCDMH